MDRNTIVDSDGVVVSTRVSREEVKRLQDKRMVLPHRRRYGTWWALVAPAIITQQLRRKISADYPIAEANYTFGKLHFSNEKGAGVVYQLNLKTCFNYSTTAACAKERENRAQLPKAA